MRSLAHRWFFLALPGRRAPCAIILALLITGCSRSQDGEVSIDVNLVVPEQFRVIAPTGTSPYQRYIDAYQRGYFAVLRQWLDEPSTDPGQLGHHLEMLGWEAAIEGHGAGIAAARAQLKTQLQRHDPSAVRAYVAELMAEK